MGYIHDHRGRLCCDACGTTDRVTLRQCPHTVLTSAAVHPRQVRPYCQPPALCDGCLDVLGGPAGVHGQRCRTGAAAAQQREDDTQARLEAGDSITISVRTATGTPHASHTEDLVLVTFRALGGERTHRVMPRQRYAGAGWLSDYDALADVHPTDSA